MCAAPWPAAPSARWWPWATRSRNDPPRQYLNRLSDLMFVLARTLNRHRTDGAAGDDVYWKSERMAQGGEGGEG